jgi:hypothetical protein
MPKPKPKQPGPNIVKLIRHMLPRLLACAVVVVACAAMALTLGETCLEVIWPASAGVLASAGAAVTMLATFALQQARALDFTERLLELEVSTRKLLADDLSELRKSARRTQETQPWRSR